MVTEAQIFLTRKCNMNCGYCKLTERQFEKELNLVDWMLAYRRLEQIGIKTVKLMGGEPTVKGWLPDLLRFASRTSIKTALLSNSHFDDDVRKKIADSLPWGYFASIDSLKSINAHKDPVKKSMSGYGALQALKNTNIPLLAANVVINKHNYKDIPEIVQHLSDEGFWVNLCMVQHTKDEAKEFSRVKIKSDYLFTEEDLPDLEFLSNKLVQMKKDRVKISVPYSYLTGITKYGIGCNWKCKQMSQLRIDADGGLMLCNEHRTDLANKYNVVHLNEISFQKFLKDWDVVRSRTKCSGCYWSCFIQAEDNIGNSKLEFEYAA